MLPVSEAASWIALLIVSSDAPAPKSYPPYVRLAWRWFLQKRLRLSSPLSVLRLSTLSATNDELCMAEPHSCQPVRHYSAICCSFSSRNDFYRKPPKCEFGLQPFGTPICVICTPKDTRNLPPNACSFASVPRQSTERYIFHVTHALAAKVACTRIKHTFVRTPQSAPNTARTEWSARNHSCDHLYLMERLASNHTVSLPM